MLISASLFAVKFIIHSTHPFFWLPIPIKHWSAELRSARHALGPVAGEELATAAVLLLQEFPVPEPSPPFHCGMFASSSLIESLLQCSPRKSVVGKQACVSARWYFSVAAEKSPSVNLLYCQPAEEVERDLKTWGVLGWPNKSIMFVFTALIKALFLFSQPTTCMLCLVRAVVATAVETPYVCNPSVVSLVSITP